MLIQRKAMLIEILIFKNAFAFSFRKVIIENSFQIYNLKLKIE